MSEDRRVIVCNYGEATKVAAAGARAYVILLNCGGGHDRLRILVRSRGGRWVDKWENTKRLTNFHASTIPPAHPRYGDERLWDLDADKFAAVLASLGADTDDQT